MTAAVQRMGIATAPLATEGEDWGDFLARYVYCVASLLTDPICRAQEFYVRAQIVNDVERDAPPYSRLATKVSCFAQSLFYGLLAVPTAPVGTLLRFTATHLQTHNFAFDKGSLPYKKLPPNRAFTLLSWNICALAGGYSMTDGGVTPWRERIDAVIKKILDTDADVVCLYEVFDRVAAEYLSKRLREAGYPDVYHSMDCWAFGLSSGHLVASKYKTERATSAPYPKDTLVGRTNSASKGLFSVNLVDRGYTFARIHSTHLQHSEEPAFPTEEEVLARQQEMAIVMRAIDTSPRRCCTVLTGDLNLDDAEYLQTDWHTRFTKQTAYGTALTWGGDTSCVRFYKGKRASRPLNLDHTLVLNETARSIHTTLVPTRFNPDRMTKEALSDHEGLLSSISLNGSLS